MWLLTPTKAADPEAAAEQDRSLRQFGVAPEDLDQGRPAAAATATDQGFVAWAWHLDAMRLFGALRTQWRAVAAGVGVMYLGLDYSGLQVVKGELGFASPDRELFEQLQAMERGGLAYKNRPLTHP